MSSAHYKHLTLEERQDIESYLNTPNVLLKTIALAIGRSSKAIREEIKKHRILRIRANQRNKCGNQNNCNVTRLCPDCINGHCKFCRHDNCNQICPDYTSEPQCKSIIKFPFVCNGCSSLDTCKLPKYFYHSQTAHNMHSHAVSDWKKGPKKSEIEMTNVCEILEEGINNKQSISVIVNTNNLPISVATVYRYIDEHYIFTSKNIDLKRKVRYRTRKKQKPTLIQKNYEYLDGRRFDDFLIRIGTDYESNIWEMDTVLGKQGADEKCVLTLLYRRTNLQLYFLLDSCTSIEVNKVFDKIKNYLGPELFKQTFTIILTDNGKEFHDPLLIETDPETGEQLINVYYCEPRHSEQKGKCEKNHEHFREMIPKGVSMNTLSNKEINYVSNMINNYPRKQFKYKSPLQLSLDFLNKKVFSLNHLNLIPINQVKLNTILK